MPAAAPDTTNLLRLIRDAGDEADRLGPAGVAIRRHLDEAAAEASAIVARGGRPEEGVPVDKLTTGNDQ